MAKANLPNTSYAVLGLLSFGEELSGYELRKWAESMRFFYWSPAQSQIYSELRRLAKHGLVQAKEIIQQGKPDKRIYGITQEGKDEFSRWLNKTTIEPTVVKHSIVLRIFFGHMADDKRLEQVLEDYIKETQAQLAELGVVQEFTENEDRFVYPALVAEWGYSYYQAELKTAQSILERLKSLKTEALASQ